MLAAVGGQHDWMRWQWFMLGAESAEVSNSVFAVVVTISIEHEQVVWLHGQPD